MTLRTMSRATIGEDSDDLRAWLKKLPTGEPVTHTVLAACSNEAHGVERSTWFFVEADASNGLARRRCVGCGQVHAVLDSDDRWTFPPMHACRECGQSMMELAGGLHAATDPDAPEGDEPALKVSWMALGVRCVACGAIEGITDFVLDGMPLEDAARAV